MATITKVTTPDGVTHNIGGGGGGTDTTYDLSLGTLSSNTVPIKLDGSDGTTDTVYLKGAGTATLSVSGSTITITTSAGQTITYTLSGSGDTTTYTITATPSSGSATSTTIPAATQSAAGMMTSSDKTKLDGIESGAEVNVQSDWNQSNNSADDYIKNKPNIPTNTSDLVNDSDFTTKTYVDYGDTKIPFGTVDSTSTSTVMTATVPGVTSLSDGVCCYIMNGVVTSASGFTLNVNGTGALPVYGTLAAATRSTTIFNINYTMLFVYNSGRVSGGCWDVFYGYDSNSNTIGYQLRTNSMSLPVSDATYRYRLLFTSADGTKFVPATSSTSTNATALRNVNQTPIDPFGYIAYYSTTTALTAGTRPSVTALWSQYHITLGYSFNRTGAALTLTSWLPVYIKCAPQSDGSAIIDSTTPYVQALPTTDDGKIYIFLGIATAATTVEVVYHHPVYYFKDNAIRLWTNTFAPVTSVNGNTGAVTITETDPVFTASAAYGISSSDITAWNGKQDALVSGTNIKTVNNQSLLGSGNISVGGGGGSVNDVEVNGASVVVGGTAYVTVPTATSDLNNDSNFVSDASYVHTDNNYTNADVSKLNGIESGAEVNVQANWNEGNSASDAYIQNKPAIPTVYNATLTIQKNGTAIDTFTANSSVDKTVNVVVPTFDDIYPVGSIYMSANNTNPGTLFGGTWTQIQDTFLLAAGSTYTAGNTGGSSTVTLQESELPNITGTFYERRINASADNHMGSAPSGAFSRSNGDGARTVAWASSSTTVAQDQINMSFGSGNAHENMPPYLVVYVWQRTS